MEGSTNSSTDRRQEVLGMQVFDCSACSKPLYPPVYQCPNESFICYRCLHELPLSVRDAIPCCKSMDRVVDNIFVPCKHGCDTTIKYYQKEHHERTCRVGPCTCPISGCGLVVPAEALFDHLTTLHELPSVDIQYFVSFNHRVQPGTWVLRGKYSRLFLLYVAPVVQGSLDHAVDLTCVKPSGTIGCSVRFSCLDGHYQASRWNIKANDRAPTQRLCVVPKVFGGEGTDVMLSIIIDLVSREDENDVPLEDEDDDEDYDYESEEEDD